MESDFKAIIEHLNLIKNSNPDLTDWVNDIIDRVFYKYYSIFERQQQITGLDLKIANLKKIMETDKSKILEEELKFLEMSREMA